MTTRHSPPQSLLHKKKERKFGNGKKNVKLRKRGAGTLPALLVISLSPVPYLSLLSRAKEASSTEERETMWEEIILARAIEIQKEIKIRLQFSFWTSTTLAKVSICRIIINRAQISLN